MPEKIIIFDTTLRDGEQSPGASMSAASKLEIARQLARLKVDVIEAGFPVSSPGDFRAVKTIAESVKGPVIAGLARCIRKDIDSAYQAVKKAPRPRIHVFLATSEIHRRYKLRRAKEEILKMAVEAVKYARRLVGDVEFSPEDASRTEPDFLCQVVEAVITAGATTVNIPDTVGYSAPSEFGAVIAIIRERVPNIDQAVISVHCHNDLGLATANSLAAVHNGARQVECTVNGIGERAGNAALEELVMTIATRRDLFPYRTGIATKQIWTTSRLVSTLTGIRVQRNKAIVGENAFRHEAGIHQDGVLKAKETYEIIRPETIGLPHSSLVLGKHSGRHAFRKRLASLGLKLSEKDLESAFRRFKELADKKKEIFDEDLAVIVEEGMIRVPEVFHLEYIHTTSGSQTVPTATIRLRKGKEVIEDAACGDGPVDASYRTIDRITGITGELLDYSLQAVTKGKDAQGEVVVRLRSGGNTVVGRGTSTDIIEASARAYVHAVNRLLFQKSNRRA